MESLHVGQTVALPALPVTVKPTWQRATCDRWIDNGIPPRWADSGTSRSSGHSQTYVAKSSMRQMNRQILSLHVRQTMALHALPVAVKPAGQRVDRWIDNGIHPCGADSVTSRSSGHSQTYAVKSSMRQMNRQIESLHVRQTMALPALTVAVKPTRQRVA